MMHVLVIKTYFNWMLKYHIRIQEKGDVKKLTKIKQRKYFILVKSRKTYSCASYHTLQHCIFFHLDLCKSDATFPVIAILMLTIWDLDKSVGSCLKK